MTDWIKHTTDTCPVDPETVVEVRISPRGLCYKARAGDLCWDIRHWSHYRIVTPAKPPEPETATFNDDHHGAEPMTQKEPTSATGESIAAAAARRLAIRRTLERMTPEDANYIRDMLDVVSPPPEPEPEPDLIALRLECLKLAAGCSGKIGWGSYPNTIEELADVFLHYVLNGSVDKA